MRFHNDLEPNNNKDFFDQNKESKKKKNKFRPKVRGILTIIGGFVWMILLGSQFVLGNIGPYI